MDVEPQTVVISFDDPTHPPFTVARGAELSEVLDGVHSPVFFGCKSGNCGTCLIELDEAAFATFATPSETEREILESMAEGKPCARLACQLKAATDLKIRYLN